MQGIRGAAAIAAMAVLGACATAPEGDPIREIGADAGLGAGPGPGGGAESGPVERTPDTCGLAAYEVWLGQPGAGIDPAAFDVPVRVIGPNDIVTQDYDPQRVNFHTDGQGRVVRVSCG
jgi:hypothetical protein